MSWRRVPPVYSPIEPSAVARALLAAAAPDFATRQELEDELGRVFEARHVLLTDRGISALILALRAAAPSGASVAMPGYACIDLIAAAIGASMRVMLYDTQPDTLAPDLESVRAVLGAGARALVVAPLYGYPVPMRDLAALAREYGVPLIEDAAQGTASVSDGRRVGAFGDLSILSFGRGKGTTAGSGGALLARGPSADDWMRRATAAIGPAPRGATHVVALAAQWLLARPALYSLPASIPALKLGEMVYHEPAVPAAMSHAAVQVLRAALRVEATEARIRRAHAATLAAACARTRQFVPIRPPSGSSPGYLRFAVLDSSQRAEENLSIGAVRGYPMVLADHPATRPLLENPDQPRPGAAILRDRLFTLPTHSRVARRDLTRLASWLGDRTGTAMAPHTEAA